MLEALTGQLKQNLQYYLQHFPKARSHVDR
jgi:hypothetical protein